MHRKFASRFALTTLLTLAACIRLNAQTVTLTPVTGTTVHKSAGMVPVQLTASSLAGLRSVSLSGGYGSANNFYLNNSTTALLTLSFYVSYFPVGDYTFHGTAVSCSGKIVNCDVTLHLVN